MALELRKAQRAKAYIKIGLAAPSGGGKTVGGLMLAYGMMKKKYPNKPDEFRWSKIAVIDTENGSGELYANAEIANVKIGEYAVVPLSEPFTTEKYIQAIKLCTENDIEVCIIDSTTHLWTGTGGLLELQGNIAKKSGNSYTAWADVTPKYKQFIDTMLQEDIHIIATARSKEEYSIDVSDTGKKSIRKLGLEPEQRKGFDYEFTVFFDVDADHTASASKDRTGLFDQRFFKITPEIGIEMMTWLEGGTTNTPTVIATAPVPAEPGEALSAIKAEIVGYCKDLGGQGNSELMDLIRKYDKSGNPNSINDAGKLGELRARLIDMKELAQVVKN